MYDILLPPSERIPNEPVADIIQRALGLPGGLTLPEANIVQDLGADSLDLVEIIMEIEHSYNIAIPDETLDDLDGVCKTVGSLQAFVDAHVAPKEKA